MIYGYIRVSSDKQTVENRRFEIERNLISQRTREALARKRSEGASITSIARACKISRTTLSQYISNFIA